MYRSKPLLLVLLVRIVVAVPLREFDKEITVLNNRQEIHAQLETARRELRVAQERVTVLEAQVLTDGSPAPPLLEPDSYFLTFDELREGCQILDFDWRYLYINDAAAYHGRQSKTQLLGRTLLECYPGVEASAMFATLRRCMAERTTAQIENEFVYADGSSAWFELRIQPVPQGLFILSLDITDRHQAEAQLQRLHRTLTVLSDINQAIVRIRHIPTLLQHACQVAVEKGNFNIAWIGLCNGATAPLQPVAHAVASAADQEKLAVILHDAILIDGILTTMSENKAPVLVKTEAARQAGYGAAVTLPLVVAGAVRGALTLYTGVTGFFDEAELRLLDEMANDLSFALEFAEQDGQRQQAEMAVKRYTAMLEEHVAEIKRGQEALQRSEIYYRRILETAQEGVWITTSVGKTTYVNHAMAGMLGYTVEEMLHTPLHIFVYQETQGDVARRLAERQQGRGEQYDVQLRRKDGTPLWVLINSTPIADETGQMTSQVAMVADITERKRAEQALRESEQRFQRMADTAPAMLWVTDATGARTFLSRGWYEFTGLTPATALGHSWFTAVHPEDRTYAIDLFRRATEQQEAIQFDYRIRRVDGEYRWVMSTAHPNFSEERVFIGHIGSLVDIHERKLAEQKLQSLYEAINQHAAELESRVIARTTQLQAAKDRGEAILNNSPDAILLLTRDLAIQQANQAFDQLFACQPADYFNQPLTAFVQPEDAALLQQTFVMGTIAAQSKFVELRARRQDDTIFHVEMSLRSINSAELVCTVRDITERKKVEETLQLALAKERELNELKSRFVSMASHEFRTPLAAILTLTETLSSYRARMTEEQIDQRLQRIREQIGYLTEIMNDVLQLAQLQARRAEFNPTLLDLDALCRNVIDEYQNRPNVARQFLYTCDPALQAVQLDRKLMRQILSNLLSNAIKYSAKDTLIKIDLCYCDPNLILKISDQGIGIPARDLPHLFDPFHRAANVGTISGTGLGLTITKESVELHGGTIMVESQENRGTSFTISLPVLP